MTDEWTNSLWPISPLVVVQVVRISTIEKIVIQLFFNVFDEEIARYLLHLRIWIGVYQIAISNSLPIRYSNELFTSSSHIHIE